MENFKMPLKECDDRPFLDFHMILEKYIGCIEQPSKFGGLHIFNKRPNKQYTMQAGTKSSSEREIWTIFQCFILGASDYEKFIRDQKPYILSEEHSLKNQPRNRWFHQKHAYPIFERVY